MSQAKHTCSTINGKIPEKFEWAFTPYGYKFLTSHPYRLNAAARTTNNASTTAAPTATAEDDSMFSILSNRSEPLAYVMKDYREHLLEKALQCLCGAGHAKNDVASVKPSISDDAQPNLSTSQISDVLCYTQLLNGCKLSLKKVGIRIGF